MKMKSLCVARVLWTGWILSVINAGAATSSDVGRMPVKEVTVFKDGHAFVLQEGKLPTEGGNVVLDYLPTPVIGTFWAYSKEEGARLSSVVAGRRRALIERTALTLRELIEGNPGAAVSVTESNGRIYSATIIGFPRRSPAEHSATRPPNAPESPPETSQLVLLKNEDGVRAVPLERIQDLVFRQPPKPMSSQEEFRNILTCRLDWNGRAPAAMAEVGLVYLQKGMRWIPSYKVDLDGKGQANISLQATVLNELTDLEGATLQLVIGLPSFQFKDTLDPIAGQQAVAQLSSYFQTDAGRGRASALVANFSNSLMTQMARAGENVGAGPADGAAEGNQPDSGKNEDLYVFTVRSVTLKKGERAVFSLADFTLPYDDVYRLDIPFAPPVDLRQNFNNQQQAELARLLSAPKVLHRARLRNTSPYPLTTAPALLLREGRVMAQGMMTYAAPGASVDVEVTAALDIAVKKTDRETGRTPNAYSHAGSSYMRVDLEGQVRLTNHRLKPVTVEVVRQAFGHIDSAGPDGRVEMNNVFEGSDGGGSGGYYPDWLGYSWPYWWHHVNGVGRVSWELKLEPGKPFEIGYKWHYFWH